MIAKISIFKATKYYGQKSSTYPGISYLYKKDVKPDIDIWLRVEIDENLFVGFCAPFQSKAGKAKLTHEEAMRHLPQVSEPRFGD